MLLAVSIKYVLIAEIIPISEKTAQFNLMALMTGRPSS